LCTLVKGTFFDIGCEKSWKPVFCGCQLFLVANGLQIFVLLVREIEKNLGKNNMIMLLYKNRVLSKNEDTIMSMLHLMCL
jgi:hypothetical protein